MSGQTPGKPKDRNKKAYVAPKPKPDVTPKPKPAKKKK
tara:strand:- start:1193 stop:1306 length:114 start_codon:yes stop_codon:yes gene_type:complete